MADFAPADGEDDSFLTPNRGVTAFDDSDDELDEEELKKRNFFERCVPRRRNRELILGLLGGIVVVSLLLTAVVLSLTTRANRPTVVILVSLDGFATSYLTAPGFEHPNLDKIAARGVKMETIPVFPSLTFPNHWSIVTGLWPESSGIIANRFLDPATNRVFSYTNATEANDLRWWKGEPFWTTVQKAGMKSASYFWPGSEVQGLQPDYFFPYDGTVNNSDRVKKVVEWLDMDWTQRPSFINLYISDIDTAGHRFGPTATETAAAVKAVDDVIGQLLLAIDNEGRQNRLLIDLLIVSDHGMTSINPNRTILIDRVINMTDVIIPDLGGPIASIWPVDPNKTESIVNLLQAEPGMLVMRKKDIPQDFHLRGNPNVAPILAVADLGWMITTTAMRDSNPSHYSGGAHGYDPREQRDMHGILVAYGPHIRNTENNNQILGPLNNVEIYNLLACILQVGTPPNNGTTPCQGGILTDKTMRSARFRKEYPPAA